MTQVGPKPWTMLEGQVALSPGEEWHSPLLNAGAGDRIEVEAVAQTEFCIGLYRTKDYMQRFEAGTPFWGWPKIKWTKRTLTRTTKKPETYRVVVRDASSSPPCLFRVAVTIREPSQNTSETPKQSTMTVWQGSRWGPFRVWDAVEPAILAVVFGLLVFLVIAVNVDILSRQWPVVIQGGGFAVSLFQADAEWGIFLAALYVAIKTIPEWISSRRRSGL